MALTQPRLQSGDLALTCREPSQRAAQENPTARSWTPSAMSSTTFTAPNVDDTSVGLMVVPENGNARGIPRQILSHAGTVATVDSPWVDVTGVTTLRGWMPPDVPWLVTTADAVSLFDVISTRHAAQANEPDGFWNSDGDQMIKLGGAGAGTARTIGAFTASTGTAADSATAATSVGDLFIVRSEVKMEADLSATVNQKTLERRFIGTGNLDADVPVPITTDGKVDVELAIKPITVAGASGVVTGKPGNLNQFLEDHFTRNSDTGGTVVTAGAAVIDLSASALTQGGFLLLNTGEVVQILSTQSAGQDVATYTTGALTFGAVTASSIAYASTWYGRKTTNFRTRTWDLYRGGLYRQLLQGCMPTLSLMVDRDQVVRFKFSYVAPESFEYNRTRPVALGAASPLSLFDVGIPVDGKGSRCLIDGTRVNISSLQVDFGLIPKIRPSLGGVNQADGCFMDVGPVKGSFTILADDDDKSGFISMADRVRSRRYIQFLYQKGSAALETFAFAMPAMHLVSNTFNHVDREGTYSATFQATNPEAAGYSGTPGAFTNLPAASFGWM